VMWVIFETEQALRDFTEWEFPECVLSLSTVFCCGAS